MEHTEQFLLDTADAFNGTFGRTQFTHGGPTVQQNGEMLFLRANLQPYNDSGVDSLNIWLDGAVSRISVSAQVCPEGGPQHGFGQVMAEQDFDCADVTEPEQLALMVSELGKCMK